jgi:hypothetical protein
VWRAAEDLGQARAGALQIKLAVISGNPMGDGLYVIRLETARQFRRSGALPFTGDHRLSEAIPDLDVQPRWRKNAVDQVASLSSKVKVRRARSSF